MSIMNKIRALTAAFMIAVIPSIGRATARLIVAPRDSAVEALLKRMTLEEKIGQMTQLTLGYFLKKGSTGGIQNIDREKLEKAIVKYHIGSILNVANEANTVDQWHQLITTIQTIATTKTRLGIPVLYGIDAIHGATYSRGATLFPQPIAVAAARDPALTLRIAEITALEVRASGIPWNFYPVLDVGRQPLWPRLYETFGEDVYLVTAMGTAFVQGLQGDNIGAKDKVAACLKHYMGYSFPWSGKDRTPAIIDERTLREYFLPPFAAAVKAGAATVMVNSSQVNGVSGHANAHFLTDILKGELGFKGFIVSDWKDIEALYIRDRAARSHKEAVRKAVMAGVDMSMVPNDLSFYDLLLGLVREGAVPESRIDDAVRRILTVKMQLGLFKAPYPDDSLRTQFASRDSADFNLRVAQEAVTLLKNADSLLPLKKGTKILVAGPAANLLSSLNGGWTITWQGDKESLYPKDKMTLLQAIESKAGSSNVAFVPGADFDKPIDIDAAVKAADKSDVVIIALGEKPYAETPGNIDDLTLDRAQLQLAQALIKTGKPVVLVLLEGRPRVISEIADQVQAIVMGYYPGMEGGRAIADVLFGDVNPSGRLPFTYPRHPNALTLYDHMPMEEIDMDNGNSANKYDPQFPFGFGLSYTTFAYAGLKLDKTSISSSGGTLGISVQVKNTGRVAGKEVVELYLTQLYGEISRPARQLKRFAKVDLMPGESTVVSFALNADDLSYIGPDNRRIVEPGRFRAVVAHLSQEFEVKP